MSRIATPATVAAAPEASRPLLEAVGRQLGVVPNLFRMVSNSHAALEGYVGLLGALAKGALPAATPPLRSGRRKGDATPADGQSPASSACPASIRSAPASRRSSNTDTISSKSSPSPTMMPVLVGMSGWYRRDRSSSSSERG